MTTVAFIGLGNMGRGMAIRHHLAGRTVLAFDLSSDAVAQAVAKGAIPASSIADAVRDCDIVFTMLPTGQHVRSVYLDHIIPFAPRKAKLIDCSTIDVETARDMAVAAAAAGFVFADAPVSGGTMAADAGTLAFMVGCNEDDFSDIQEALRPMSRAIIRAGDHGAGQAAKICNNMLLGISMIGVCEAFNLADRLGLAADRFFEIASKSSGQCWSLTSYAPWPGVGPETPADRNYEGGFAVAMMLKDLKLAQQEAIKSGATTPLGAHAEAIYSTLDWHGWGGRDFSVVLKLLRGDIGKLPDIAVSRP